MSFNSVVSTFTTLLNRDDMTAAQASTFVQQAISRIQREVRLPCMERTQLVTAVAAISWITVPFDLLQLQDIYVEQPDGTSLPLIKIPLRTLMQSDMTMDPTFYSRFQNQFFIAGMVSKGTVLKVLYHGSFTPITDPNTDNEITATEPDMITYAALGYAGDFYEHPATDRWEQKYQGMRDSVKQMAEDLENTGGPAAVQMMYPQSGYQGYWP